MFSIFSGERFLSWFSFKYFVSFYSDIGQFQYSWGPSWSWPYGSWIYNYLYNQCISPLSLRVRIPFKRGVLDITLCDKVWQLIVAGWWFSPVSSTNKTGRHDITEILLKVALNTITITVKWKWRPVLKSNFLYINLCPGYSIMLIYTHIFCY